MQKNQKNNGKPVYWDEACRYLSQKDNILKGLIKEFEGQAPLRVNSGFYTLARSIVGQQISVKAAESIWNRLAQACKGKVEPKVVLKLTEEKLREIGLSGQKAKYLHNCAAFFVSEMKGATDLTDHDHIEIGEKLIAVKGIGLWTVEMFLIFHMHSPDILPLGDIGLINGVKKLYGVKIEDKKLLVKKVEKIAEKWRPYRSVATWFIWRSLDPLVVEY